MKHESAPNQQPTIEEQRLAVFPTVAEFALDPASEFAAGPDVKVATGLSHTDIMALGYNNLADIKTAALSWKEEQDAAAAKQAHQAEADAREVTYQAA